MSEPNLLILANLIADRARTDPDLEVLTFESDGELQTRTYQQLWANGQRIAALLLKCGLRKGDRFALLMLNHPEFVEVMIGSAIAGTVFVPIDARTSGSKLQYLLRDCGCRGVICGSYALGSVLEVVVQHDLPVEWVYVLGDRVPSVARAAGIQARALGPVLAAPPPSPLLPVLIGNPLEPMQVMYTSGTTGDPKGIVVPHQRFGLVSTHGETVFGYRAGDRPYTGLSLTHGNAQFVTLAPALRMGLRAVISRKFSKSRLWDIVRQHGCTTFSLLGGMVTAIFSEPARNDDADNPVRLVISAGMPAALWEDFARRFGVEIFEFYGAVDGGMCFKPPRLGPLGSCGRPAPGLIAKVVNEDGDEVPRGTCGELWFRLAEGPFPPVTYLNNPQASAEKTAGGWLRSGDIVRMDEQGWMFFEHRVGGGIRRNGEFVSPAALERILSGHPEVDDVFVYGVPADSGAPGEKDVVAAVVPTVPACFDAQLVFRWLASRVEPNLMPTYLQQVAEIPKTASEKPQARFLAELWSREPDKVSRVRMPPAQ